MQKLGITSFYGSREADTLEEFKKVLEVFKKEGFGEVSFSVCECYRPLELTTAEIDLARKMGFTVKNIHSSYIKPNKEKIKIDELWLEEGEGDFYLNSLKKDVDTCADLKCTQMVVHINDKKYDYPTEIGLKRIEELCQYAKKKNVIVAIENTHSEKLIYNVLEALKHLDNLMYCFDVGHMNCFETDRNFLLLTTKIDKLICLHLHDNDTSGDQHLPLGFGNVDKDKLKQLLAQRPDVTLLSETLKAVPYMKDTITDEKQIHLIKEGLAKLQS